MVGPGVTGSSNLALGSTCIVAAESASTGSNKPTMRIIRSPQCCVEPFDLRLRAIQQLGVEDMMGGIQQADQRDRQDGGYDQYEVEPSTLAGETAWCRRIPFVQGALAEYPSRQN